MEIKLHHIKKQFSGRAVLRDISLVAESGSCIGILGENGCGKSTLLTILAGILQADGGEFFWGQEELLQNEKRRRHLVGYVPQGTPLLPELTALDHLRLWYGGQTETLQQDLEEGVPAMLGVTDFLSVPVRQLSGGMKKRLSISCAVADRPPLLLLDEPAAALDLICKERINNYLLDFKRQGGTILLATHEVQDLALCDSLYILKQGVLQPYEYDGNLHRLVGRL